MAKFDDEQLKQLQSAIGAGFQEERHYTRQLVREEVRDEVARQLEPMNQKLDRIMKATIEDADALATDDAKLSRRIDNHEARIKKLEIKLA